MKRKKPTNKRRGFKPKVKKNTQLQNANPPAETPPKTSNPDDGMALNKYVAQSGICSRRKAVELIEKGLVTVNGVVAEKPFHRVKPDDTVEYQGKVIKPEEKKQYILLNKPKNCITSHHDPEGRKTVIDIVGKAVNERIFPVGRLDRNTTGLLLLTNDGDLAKKLSHPSHKVNKLYYTTLDQPVPEEHVNQILAGLELEDGVAEVDACGYVDGGNGFEIGIEIHIGRNRIVRRIFEHFGYRVKKLDRVYYAGLTKKDLPRGRWRHLTEKEILMLKHFT